MRCGADHLISVAYEEVHTVTCPVMAFEEFVSIGSALGWDIESGYLFPVISTEIGREPHSGASPISAPSMAKSLQAYARDAGERALFTMHSFRSRGAIAQVLDGSDLSTIMTRAFWEGPSDGVEVFPLSEQSRECAAFGKDPLLLGFSEGWKYRKR